MTTTNEVDGAGSAEPAGSFGAPRALLLVVGFAAAFIVISGLNAVSFIIGPVFLSLVLVITVYPAQQALVRRGARPWMGLMAGFILTLLILVVILGSVLLALAKFATLIPQYASEAEHKTDSLTSKLDSMGVNSDTQKALSDSFDPSTLLHFVTDILSGLASTAGAMFFLITVLMFMTFDAWHFPPLLEKARSSRPLLVDALAGFAKATRVYLVVSTIFGFIVAVIDTMVLAVIGVPAAAAWGVLAFVTNYIPNIGFVIGLVPPAIMALLAGGVGDMVLVIVAYCVINFILQSIIQPKFVADAVGLSPTITIVSLFFWAWALGAVGALLAVPLSLFVRAIFIDADPRTGWLRPFVWGSASTGKPPDTDGPAVQT
jgi:predicted PurR-regulated permease PerM